MLLEAAKANASNSNQAKAKAKAKAKIKAKVTFHAMAMVGCHQAPNSLKPQTSKSGLLEVKILSSNITKTYIYILYGYL